MPALTLDLPPEVIDAIAAAVVEEVRPSDGYFDSKAAAEYLAAPRSRIHDLVEDGRLVPYRDGRRLLFTRAQLDAILTR